VQAHTQVDLGDRRDTETLGHVDEQSDVDAVAVVEGEVLEDLTTARVLAAQRLHDVLELRKQQ
jgi:hypothetical protein